MPPCIQPGSLIQFDGDELGDCEGFKDVVIKSVGKEDGVCDIDGCDECNRDGTRDFCSEGTLEGETLMCWPPPQIQQASCADFPLPLLSRPQKLNTEK